MIKDSGERREFSTGAVRDIQEGKGRCDLLPLKVVSPVVHDFESEILQNLDEFQATGSTYNLWLAVLTFVENVYGKSESERANALLEVSKHFEEGAKKYGEYNWQKGIPTHCYIDSAVRHLLKYIRGDRDEHHERAFLWNIFCCEWTCEHKPELNDYAKEVNR